jgi:hypothetical protein
MRSYEPRYFVAVETNTVILSALQQAHSVMEIPGYEIVQELSRNQARVICRALRRRDGQTVLLATQLGGPVPAVL